MNKIIILSMVFAALTGVGLLTNFVILDIQPLGMFNLVDTSENPGLPGSICSCNDGEGNFSPLFCQQFAETGIYSDNTEMRCEALAPNGYSDYGVLPIAAAGCGVDFWSSHADEEKYPLVWTAGYSPDYYYNDMFQVDMKLPDEVLESLETVEQEEEESLETVEQEKSTETDEVETDEFGNAIISEPETVEQEVEESLETVEQAGDGTKTDEVEIDEFGNVKIPEPKKGLSLLQALELEGTQLNELVRESVAAMLNSAHPEIDYMYSVPEIISMTQISMAHEDYNETIAMLKEANDMGNTPICFI